MHPPFKSCVLSRQFRLCITALKATPVSSKAPALRCKLIITQIGRENNISAKIILLRTVEVAKRREGLE